MWSHLALVAHENYSPKTERSDFQKSYQRQAAETDRYIVISYSKICIAGFTALMQKGFTDRRMLVFAHFIHILSPEKKYIKKFSWDFLDINKGRNIPLQYESIMQSFQTETNRIYAQVPLNKQLSKLLLTVGPCHIYQLQPLPLHCSFPAVSFILLNEWIDWWIHVKIVALIKNARKLIPFY